MGQHIPKFAAGDGLHHLLPHPSKALFVVFHAGSLTIPLEAMEQNFEALHPDIDIQRTAGGSTKMARMISEEGKPADIMASADYTVIDKNLIPKFADWNIRFASNQLVLCYTDKSRFADSVNGEVRYSGQERGGLGTF